MRVRPQGDHGISIATAGIAGADPDVGGLLAIPAQHFGGRENFAHLEPIGDPKLTVHWFNGIISHFLFAGHCS